MPRRPIIKNAVLEVLRESETALRFSELKTKAEEKLHRQIHAEALAAANSSLVKAGSIEKKLNNGKITYELSSQFHKQSVKNLLLRLMESLRLDEISADFDLAETTLPDIVSISPTPKDTYQTDESELRLGLEVDWESPASGISSIVCNDFLILPRATQEGIINLILWAYWKGIQNLKHSTRIYEVEMPAMESQLINCLKFATKALQGAKERSDTSRIETEGEIIRILKITLELLKKENLHDFLSCASKKEEEVRKAENIIIANEGHFMSSGERIFHRIVRTKNDMVIDGLDLGKGKMAQVNALKSFFQGKLPRDETVWNHFIDFLIGITRDHSLKDVQGNQEQATANVKAYLPYLNDLLSLIRKRQIMAIYLWNIPFDKEAEKYLKLPQFEEWFRALKDGDLSHRVWLFEEETIKDVESAYRAVKRGREPKPWKIDKEFWTLRDLYELHPDGKDPRFWYSLLTTLKAKRGEKPYRGGPVPEKVYLEFTKKQRIAVKELIDKQKKTRNS
jgi:hypothetical protein